MKKKYLLLGLFLIVTIIMFDTAKVTSNIIQPPAGSTGDASPANTCARAGCHASFPIQNPGVGDVTINIGVGTPATPLDASFEYVPGTLYSLEFLINRASARYGFEVSAANAALAQAGTFALTDATHTSLSSAFNRSYVGHKSASTFHNWGFNWTAPAAGTGPVTIYYAYNRANGDGTPFNDSIYKSSVTIQEMATGIKDISKVLSELNIFPNPVSNQFSLSFDLKEANRVSSRIYSLDGKVCKELLNEKVSEGSFNQSFDIAGIPAGVYLVQLNVGESSVTRKIMKL
jgi:hypothetical protein